MPSPAGAGAGASQSSGAPGDPLDIIDLDRYMRGAVRPQTRRLDPRSERLVVDGGGHKLSSSGSELRDRDRDKRYSHDSGLSDGSYLRRRRPHRRGSAGGRGRRERSELSGRASASDLRSFRAVCERALRDQQEQIARVAVLCERLTAAQAGVAGGGGGGVRRHDSSSELSDLSSTSRSRSRSEHTRRRDRHRVANEYKTYKIIMSKLDDLNRRLAARAAAGAAGGAGRVRGAARGGARGSHSHSARSDAPTPPAHCAKHAQGRMTRASSRLVERAVGGGEGGASGARAGTHEVSAQVVPGAGAASIEARSQVSRVGREEARAQLARLAPRRAHELDIAPRDALPVRRSPRLNVATESVVAKTSSSSGESARARLEPVADHSTHTSRRRREARSRRSHSAAAAGKRSALCSPLGSGSERGRGGGGWHAPTLCHLCRSYWRALRHYIAHQFANAAVV